MLKLDYLCHEQRKNIYYRITDWRSFILNMLDTFGLFYYFTLKTYKFNIYK
jgi:hypothetical protein